MATITTLRPSATSSGVGWTAKPSGTLHGVTADDDDTTYAEWSGSGSAMILATPLDSPPVGERRHLVRVRARGEGGSAWWAVRLATGQLVAGASASFGGSPETVAGSWQAGAPADGPTTLSCFVEGQSDNVRIIELFVDVDTRAAPTFTPQILDGSGTPTTTITDTVTPTARVSALNLDGLPARQYRYWVTDASSAIVWDTGVVSGPAVDRLITPLENGTYTLHQQVWSTLGTNTAYASVIEELTFTMAVGAVPAPNPPVVTPEEPFFRVQVCAPDVSGFDDSRGWVQLQRVDCPHGGYLHLPGLSGSYAWAPDADHLNVTGDLEVTVLAQRFDGWRPQGRDETLISKYLVTGDQRSWRLSLDWDGADNGSGADEARAGRPFLAWSPDGTLASLVTAFADERAPIDALGRVHLRVFLDVDNGAGNWEVTFETMDETGVWRQLGNVVTGPGPTSIHASTAELAVGSYSGGVSENFEGRILRAQVRSGRTGPVVASPDFTGHPLGTTQFDDAQGNTWTVAGGASIHSDQRITTIAILGPLETDQCAEWLDFTVPRNGMGRNCDHQPEPCCSYYRARTVGRVEGSILVSNWSDAFNPGVPAGLIFAWPGTEATIPFGWSRVTALDQLYPKGIPTANTQPGNTGGSATHSHTTPGHTHTLSHSHPQSAGTSGSSSASQTFGGSGSGAGTTHAHDLPTTDTSTANISSQSSAPGTSAVPNDPARLEVIWIESNGNPLGVPDGALGLFPDIAPDGWDTYADATGRFLKGAAPGGDGGATAASELDNHTHTINSHTHAGTSHTHTSASTGPRIGSLPDSIGGSGNPRVSNAHTHPITVNSSTTASLQSASGGTSGAASPNDPPFRNLRVRQNTSGNPGLPLGIIGLWLGSLGTIPDGWQLCDGTNGTPDMLGRYPRGATSDIEGTGGGTAGHTHTGGTHTHGTTGHSHSRSIGVAAQTQSAQSGSTPFFSNAHTHAISNTDSATPEVGSSGTGTLASTTTEPAHREVAFIQFQAEPEPPPEPETFCLEWSEDEHLIRTYGPDGPMYVPVWGMFEWEVEKPFTAATGVMGSRFVSSAPPGGRNLRMVTAVESEAELAALRAVLARPLVLISPSDSTETWAVPVAESIRVVKIGRIREVRAEFIATGPEPEPQVADVGV